MEIINILPQKLYKFKCDEEILSSAFNSLKAEKWDKNNFNQPQKDKKKLTDFAKDTTGFPMGYCAKCGESASYKDNEILYGDSRCCNAEILPKRKEFCNGE